MEEQSAVPNPGGTIALIGAGRMAHALARTWPSRIIVVHDADESRSEELAAFCGASTAPTLPALVATAADVVWIVTSDRAIPGIVEALRAIRVNWNGVTVVHSSGLLPLALLDPLRTSGAITAALHPNLSIGGDQPLPDTAIWGGDARGIRPDLLVRSLIGPAAAFLRLTDEMRPLYHAAASVAANFSTSLFALSEQLYREAGVDAAIARRLTDGYMRRAVERSSQQGPAQTITGPVVRGDWEVVRAQIAAVTEQSPELAAAFEALVVLTDRLFGRS